MTSLNSPAICRVPVLVILCCTAPPLIVTSSKVEANTVLEFMLWIDLVISSNVPLTKSVPVLVRRVTNVGTNGIYVKTIIPCPPSAVLAGPDPAPPPYNPPLPPGVQLFIAPPPPPPGPAVAPSDVCVQTS